MARFDVYHLPEVDQYVLDVQADILDELRTRVVIPLSPRKAAEKELMAKLRPIVQIGDQQYSLNTMEIAAIPCALLGEQIANLEDQSRAIVDGIDFLLQGF